MNCELSLQKTKTKKIWLSSNWNFSGLERERKSKKIESGLKVGEESGWKREEERVGERKRKGGQKRERLGDRRKYRERKKEREISNITKEKEWKNRKRGSENVKGEW